MSKYLQNNTIFSGNIVMQRWRFLKKIKILHDTYVGPFQQMVLFNINIKDNDNVSTYKLLCAYLWDLQKKKKKKKNKKKRYSVSHINST